VTLSIDVTYRQTARSSLVSHNVLFLGARNSQTLAYNRTKQITSGLQQMKYGRETTASNHTSMSLSHRQCIIGQLFRNTPHSIAEVISVASNVSRLCHTQQQKQHASNLVLPGIISRTHRVLTVSLLRSGAQTRKKR